MRLLALLLGKLVILIGRLFGRRGSSFPGLVVERMDRRYLASVLNELPDGVILVSGTNGKTTTVKMISEVMRSREPVLTNRTGANFTRGIISCLLAESTWGGKLPAKVAVFEVDEAWAARMVQQIRPRGVVITNVMRDQMDRFGEIDHTARLLGDVVAAATQFVLLNADDPRVLAMADRATVPVSYFGVGPKLRSVFISDDELYAGDIDLRDEPGKRRDADFVLTAIAPERITVEVRGEPVDVALQVYGSHNAQNATTALGVADLVGIPRSDAIRGLEHVQAAFGRGEVIELDDRRILLQLVKNPGGFRYSLMDVAGTSPTEILVAINDDHADSRDVSWLWDVDFRPLAAWPVSTTGTRAEDMALRLEYDSVRVATCTPDLRQAIRGLVERHPPGSTFLVCATYTAMFDLREILGSMTEVARV